MSSIIYRSGWLEFLAFAWSLVCCRICVHPRGRYRSLVLVVYKLPCLVFKGRFIDEYNPEGLNLQLSISDVPSIRDLFIIHCYQSVPWNMRLLMSIVDTTLIPDAVRSINSRLFDK